MRDAKVLKKRRKMGGFSIEQTDNKMFALDFFREMRFNIHEGCESPRPSSSYNVDDGYRRSAKGRAEGISVAACRRNAKISGKRTVT